MTFADLLRPEAVLLSPSVGDKWALLERLADAMVASGALPAERRDEAARALEERERCSSTGMERGIAVPHASLDGLADLAAAVALFPAGLDFACQDRAPARVVVALLVPRDQKLRHLQTLTEVARTLSDAAFQERLLASTSPDQVVALWRGL